MTDRYEPGFPGDRYESDPLASGVPEPMFDLSGLPTAESPALEELLPRCDALPERYITAPIRLAGPYMNTSATTDEFCFEGVRVQAEYGGRGNVTDSRGHLGCRLTLLHPGEQSMDDAVERFHSETTTRVFIPDGERMKYTDWVEQEGNCSTVAGLSRTTIRREQPLLQGLRHGLPNKPTELYACVVQSLPWGLLETYVYTNPTYDQAMSEAEAVADDVTSLVQECSVPGGGQPWS